MKLFGHGQCKKRRMIRFREALQDKAMWENICMEGLVVIIVAMILFFDPLLAWVSKPALNTAGVEIVEKSSRQVASEATATERNAIFNHVRTLMDNGNFDEALAVMQQYLSRDPANAEAHYLIGLAYLKKGQFKNSLDQLQQMVRISLD